MSEHPFDPTEMKKYRIGEFARRMGVSASFLKHYEQFGLIDAQTAENGYRYYPFHQSARLLACIGLHNFGFSLHETQSLLYENDADAITRQFAARSEDLRRQIDRELALADELDRQQCQIAQIRKTGFSCEVIDQEELYFLPHTSGRSFLSDEHIYELLPEWMQWLPIVKSCRRLENTPGILEQPAFCWGLAVPAALAVQHHLPLSEAVSVVPARKMLRFCYYLRDSAPYTPHDDSLSYALAKLGELGLTADGPFLYQVDLLRTHTEACRERLGYYLIPVS